jgi:hypothetical protein
MRINALSKLMGSHNERLAEFQEVWFFVEGRGERVQCSTCRRSEFEVRSRSDGLASIQCVRCHSTMHVLDGFYSTHPYGAPERRRAAA